MSCCNSLLSVNQQLLFLKMAVKPQCSHHTYITGFYCQTWKRTNPFSSPPAVYHAIYLEELTASELTEKLAQLFNISPRQISQIFKQGPTGIHVLVSDEVSTGSESVWGRSRCW